MFCDIAEAFDSVMSNPTDVKELIPEFFLNDTRCIGAAVLLGEQAPAFPGGS